jgi:hypothetical protein
MSYLAAPPRDPIKHYTRGNRESQEKNGMRRTANGIREERRNETGKKNKKYG